MTTKEEIIKIIFSSLEETNLQNDIHLALNTNTELFVPEGELDSLGLVNLILSIEERVEQFAGKYIPIADERAMSLESSPFKTVDTLANYINILLNE